MDKKKTPKLGRKQVKIEKLARELHMMVAYSTLVAVNTMTKILSTDLKPEEKAQEQEYLDRLITLSETLYDDLSPEAQEKYLEQASQFI